MGAKWGRCTKNPTEIPPHTPQDDLSLHRPTPSGLAINLHGNIRLDPNRGAAAPNEPIRGTRACARCVGSPCFGRQNGAHGKIERWAEHRSWVAASWWRYARRTQQPTESEPYRWHLLGRDGAQGGRDRGRCCRVFPAIGFWEKKLINQNSSWL